MNDSLECAEKLPRKNRHVHSAVIPIWALFKRLQTQTAGHNTAVLTAVFLQLSLVSGINISQTVNRQKNCCVFFFFFSIPVNRVSNASSLGGPFKASLQRPIQSSNLC